MFRPRRQLTRGAAVLGCIALVGATAALAASSGAFARLDETPDGRALPSDIGKFGFSLRKRTNDVALLDATSQFSIELGNGRIRGRAPSDMRSKSAHAIVSRELARYPATFFHAANLRGIVFVDSLVEGKTPIPSLPNVGGLLLLDVDAAERDLVRAIHHEIFHFADVMDDGHLSPDPSWEALNAPGFVYGAGGRTLRGAWAAGAADVPGFVSAYATSGLDEDKAETFAFAMSRRDELVARIATDVVLARKVGEIARRVATLDKAAPAALGLLYPR